MLPLNIARNGRNGLRYPLISMRWLRVPQQTLATNASKHKTSGKLTISTENIKLVTTIQHSPLPLIPVYNLSNDSSERKHENTERIDVQNFSRSFFSSLALKERYLVTKYFFLNSILFMLVFAICHTKHALTRIVENRWCTFDSRVTNIDTFVENHFQYPNIKH